MDLGKERKQANGQRSALLHQQLEKLLADKLQYAQSVLSRYTTSTTPPWASTLLRLDAYRSVMQEVVASFTTYAPLLTQIRDEYDTALAQALDQIYDAIQLRNQCSKAQTTHDTAVAEAKAQAKQDIGSTLNTLQQAFIDVSQQAEQQELEAQKLDSKLHELLSQQAELRRSLRALDVQCNIRRETMLKSSTWSSFHNALHQQ